MVKMATQNVGCLSDDQIKVHLLEGLCHFVVRIIQGADVEVTRDQGGLGVIQHTAQDIDLPLLSATDSNSNIKHLNFLQLISDDNFSV